MLNEILNLEGVAVLSKEQQKSVNGGLCAARQWRSYSPPLTGYYSVVLHELTQAQAVAWANGGEGGGHVACTAKGYANSSWA